MSETVKPAQHKNESRHYQVARKLRQSGTIIEKSLRRALRERTKETDIRFRYQYPISPYIVDFVCLSARLIVEIDGWSHDIMPDKEERQRHFEAHEFQVLRFTNAEVIKDPSAVATAMYEQANLLQKTRWKQTPPRIRDANATLPQGEGES